MPHQDEPLYPWAHYTPSGSTFGTGDWMASADPGGSATLSGGYTAFTSSNTPSKTGRVRRLTLRKTACHCAVQVNPVKHMIDLGREQR